MNNLNSLIKKNSLLLLLLGFVVATRAVLLYEGIIPFAFDHAKDSLAVMEIGKTLSPSLIGPWTSIPGLYFGPGWYYLLLPAYMLGGYEPVAAVWMMVALVTAQVLLAYKYLSKWLGVLMGLLSFSFIISTSAWNPFPMTFVSLLLLILLKNIQQQQKLTVLISFSLGFVSALGFHFSSAYAIFLPFIIAACLLFWRVSVSFKSLLLVAIGFTIPFIPQLIFELRNDFVQSQAIITYFSNGGSDAVRTAETPKYREVLQTVFGELRIATFPEVRNMPAWVTQALQLSLLAATLFFSSKQRIWKHKNIKTAGLFFLTFVGIPIIGYQFLHFNLWYVYGMTPIAAYLVALTIERMPVWLQRAWLISIVIGALSMVWFFHASNKIELSSNRSFLPIKVAAIQQIRSIAADRPFASYHYVPDIYDFSYQYLYFKDAFNDKPLPTEFAYEPNAVPYIVQKETLLTEVANQNPDALRWQNTAPEVIFYIVEEAEQSAFLEQWWEKQQFDSITDEIQLSETVWLYVATPVSDDTVESDI